jgi:hypothetical protein
LNLLQASSGLLERRYINGSNSNVSLTHYGIQIRRYSKGS